MSQAPTPDMDDRIPTLTTEISELDDLVETPAPPAPTADIDPALVLELQERGHRQLLAVAALRSLTEMLNAARKYRRA